MTGATLRSNWQSCVTLARASHTLPALPKASRMHLLLYPPLVQVDLDMLNVALGRGTLELRSALLNTDYLNSQLVRAWARSALSSANTLTPSERVQALRLQGATAGLLCARAAAPAAAS